MQYSTSPTLLQFFSLSLKYGGESQDSGVLLSAVILLDSWQFTIVIAVFVEYSSYKVIKKRIGDRHAVPSPVLMLDL